MMIKTVSVTEAQLNRWLDIAIASRELIADVQRRYPGEKLRCPHMKALNEAIERDL